MEPRFLVDAMLGKSRAVLSSSAMTPSSPAAPDAPTSTSSRTQLFCSRAALYWNGTHTSRIIEKIRGLGL